VPITPVEGRLPSAIVGLHLERHGGELRLYDPATGRWLPAPEERITEEQTARRQVHQARQQAESELDRVRRELEELRRRLPPNGERAGPSP
jgi:hypothetical protein